MIDALCESAIRHTFGHRARMRSYQTIQDGARNGTARVTCDAYPDPLLFKWEKGFALPRMQRHQIPRECAGLRLCAERDLPVPRLIAAEEWGEHPWLLERFVEGRPLSSVAMTPENRARIDAHMGPVFEALCAIRSDAYGDTFEGGYVGAFPRWEDAMARMTDIAFADCRSVGLFGASEDVVGDALRLALSRIRDASPAALYHCDLFSANVLVDVDAMGRARLCAVIDFGMSLFAPVDHVRHMMARYSDLRVSRDAGDDATARAHDVLRIEPLLMMHLHRHAGREDALRAYIRDCRAYIDR